MYIMFYSEDIGSQSCCEVANRRNNWFSATDFYGEGIPPMSDMHFQIALTSEYVAGFG